MFYQYILTRKSYSLGEWTKNVLLSLYDRAAYTLSERVEDRFDYYLDKLEDRIENVKQRLVLQAVSLVLAATGLVFIAVSAVFYLIEFQGLSKKLTQPEYLRVQQIVIISSQLR